MNHLAHALLACDQRPGAVLSADQNSVADGLIVGGLLGDFVRGRLENLPYCASVKQGIRVHRRIDGLSDRHPQVLALKLIYPKPWRRYAGIVLDMHFDHVLVRQWQAWSDVPLVEFTEYLFRRWRAFGKLPVRAQAYIDWAQSRQLFQGYGNREVIEKSLAGISGRLRHANPLARSGEIMWQFDERVEAAFPEVFADLQGVVRSITSGS